MSAEMTLVAVRNVLASRQHPLGPSKADTIAELVRIVGGDTCAEMRALCSSCGGTGDVHGIDGEWRGECKCAVAQAGRIASLEAMAIVQTAELNRAATVKALLVEALERIEKYTSADQSQWKTARNALTAASAL